MSRTAVAKRERRYRTVDVATMRKWRADRRADFEPGYAPPTNKRAAHCRVCGRKLVAGEGVGYIELMSDYYRGADRYVCPNCEVATRPAVTP